MSIPPRPTSPKRPLQQHRNSIAPNNDDRFEDYYIAGEEVCFIKSPCLWVVLHFVISHTIRYNIPLFF